MSVFRRPRPAWPHPAQPSSTALVKHKERESGLEDSMCWRMSQHKVHSFYLLKIPADTHIHSHPHIQYGVRSWSCRDRKVKFPRMIRVCSFCAKRSVSFLTLDFLDLLSHYLDHAGDHMPSCLPPLLAEFSFWQQEESHRRAGPWFTGSVWASIFICVLEER